MRVFLVSVLLALGTVGHAAAAEPASHPAPSAVAAFPASPSAPEPTINEFFPEDRAIGDCISAAPKPGCGSEARGGWRQSLVLVLLVAGLAFVGWRIVAGVRIPHPVGNPTLTPEKEREVRAAVTRRALEVLTQPVEGPRVFRVDHPGVR